jgi:ketosteroid isomerase-like protein
MTPASRLARFAAVALTIVPAAAFPGRAGAQAASPRHEVEAREIAFAQTMADRDFEAFLTFISPEAVFFGGGEPLRGREAVARAWRPFFDGPEAPFSWRPDTVDVLDSGELALTSGPVLDASGEPAGRFNSIWRLDPDGVWRVVFDRGS